MKINFTRFLPVYLLVGMSFMVVSICAQPCSTLSITSVTPVAAACPSGGSITVAASGTGLSYQLISGPAGFSNASNTMGIFSTLNAGNYVVEVRDACAVKQTQNVTVTNTYPAFSVATAATSNLCTSGISGGTISGTVTGGKPPYQYSAVPEGSTPVYGASTASTSYNLTVSTFGKYRVYAKDNCGEVRTYDILLHPTQPVPVGLWWEDLVLDRPCAETMDGLPTITWNLHFVDSNGTAIGFNKMLGSAYQVYKPAVANSISSNATNCTAPLGTLLTSGTITSGNIPSGDTVTYPVVIPQEDVILVFTNLCGQQFKFCYNFNGGDPVTPITVYRFIQQTCSASWATQSVTINNKYVFNMTAPYTFVLTKSNSSTVTNTTGDFTNLAPADFPASITVTDACGRTDTKNFTMPVQGAALQFSVGPEWGLTCTTVKNTATAEIVIEGGDLPGWADATNIVITGGTATAVPIISPYNDWVPGYIASNLLAGYTYKVMITNLCGEKDSVQFTVPADQWGQNTLNWNLTTSVNALCGANKSTITANAAFTGYRTITYNLYNLTAPNTIIATNTTGVFNNVTPGNYKVKFVVPGAVWPCPGLDIKDSATVTVLADGAGQNITRKTITTCEVGGVPTLAGKAIIEVSGSAPFTYEIIKTSLIGTGGEAWTLSSTGNSSNTYTWDIPVGADPSNTIYTLRTTDKCGNKVTTQASLQPINPPAIMAQNNPCLGDINYTLSVNTYGGNFTYRWVKMPNVATTLSTATTLTFPGAYTALHDGTYRCYVELAGCVERYVDVVISSLDCNKALPVKLLSFTGNYANKTGLLKWTSESEVNFKYYEVERSSNGREFYKINTVLAKHTANGASDYSVTDNLSSYSEAAVYYRLKTVDTDGKFAYSPIVRLNINDNSTEISVYPNPVKDEMALLFNNNVTDRALIKIIDKAGRVILQNRINVIKGNNAVKVPDINKLITGTYILQVQTSNGMKATKFVKL